ncbi:MAG: polyphenol oxidase family protein [Acidobacteriota bacterium]
MESAGTARLSGESWPAADRWRDVRVLFEGRERAPDRDARAGSASPPGERAWLQQIHSERVFETAKAGCAGEGDGLLSCRRDLALCVVTADCVPVLMASDEQIAAVHAGWRGVASRIVPGALGRFRSRPRVAWIGPAISGRSYEVSTEVAAEIVAASGEPRVVLQGRAERPHVDLPLAVEVQLRSGGVEDVRRLDLCTFEETERLWSYRREGRAAGRNHSRIWRCSA